MIIDLIFTFPAKVCPIRIGTYQKYPCTNFVFPITTLIMIDDHTKTRNAAGIPLRSSIPKSVNTFKAPAELCFPFENNDGYSLKELIGAESRQHRGFSNRKLKSVKRAAWPHRSRIASKYRRAGNRVFRFSASEAPLKYPINWQHKPQGKINTADIIQNRTPLPSGRFRHLPFHRP